MSDYESLQRRRNITVGIFVIMALTAVGWLIFIFGDLPLFVSKFRSFQIKVQFPTAPGVEKDTPVRFCGYQIGKVSDVQEPKILKDQDTQMSYHQTMVILSIDKRYDDIPMDVEVKLMTRGLGSSYIELAVDPELHDPNWAKTHVLVEGMLLQGSTGMTSEFFPQESQEKLDELATGLKSLIENTNEILGEKENQENIKAVLSNLTETSAQATKSLRQAEKFFSSATRMSEELSKALIELQQILEKIDQGPGTAAKLVNDGRLYENLLENTEQLKLLLEEAKTLIKEYREKGVKVKL